MGLEDLKLLRPNEIMQIASQRALTSAELLPLASRSFSVPIAMLEHAKGKNEANKRAYVEMAYSLFRALDEIEDASKELNNEEKRRVINGLAVIVGEVTRREPNCKGIEDIIEGNDFRSIIKRAMDGAVDEEKRVFLKHFGKGVVLRDLYEIGREENGKEIKEAMDYCIQGMAHGMTKFLGRPIQTSDELKEYCYHVAGRIGSGFLNKIVELRDRDETGRPIILRGDLAEKFGEYLQETNIAKNIYTDYKEGRRFLPDEWRRRDVAFETMMDLNEKGIGPEDAREKMFKKILDFQEKNFRDSVEYVESIPQHLNGYRAFCLISLITAQKTLEHLRVSGAEKVFSGEESATKIQYGLKHILDFSYNISCFEDGMHANNWLSNYRREPDSFSFKPVEYEMWAWRWFPGSDLKNK